MQDFRNALICKFGFPYQRAYGRIGLLIAQ